LSFILCRTPKLWYLNGEIEKIFLLSEKIIIYITNSNTRGKRSQIIDTDNNTDIKYQINSETWLIEELEGNRYFLWDNLLTKNQQKTYVKEQEQEEDERLIEEKKQKTEKLNKMESIINDKLNNEDLNILKNWTEITNDKIAIFEKIFEYHKWQQATYSEDGKYLAVTYAKRGKEWEIDYMSIINLEKW
jgi:hypothetical protein